MTDAWSIKIQKSFAFRGGTKVWANRYHLSGDFPDTLTKFEAVSTAIRNLEKPCHGSGVSWIGAVGYAADSDIPVYSTAYTGETGTAAFTGADLCPGECAALVRYTTDQRSTKNHPIYLFNYYHSVYRADAGTADALLTAQKDKFNLLAAGLISGVSDGTNTHKRAGPRGAIALTGACQLLITHRDFRR